MEFMTPHLDRMITKYGLKHVNIDVAKRLEHKVTEEHKAHAKSTDDEAKWLYKRLMDGGMSFGDATVISVMFNKGNHWIDEPLQELEPILEGFLRPKGYSVIVEKGMGHGWRERGENRLFLSPLWDVGQAKAFFAGEGIEYLPKRR
jgi:hypothetical protein